jgi:hypothetical protein
MRSADKRQRAKTASELDPSLFAILNLACKGEL